jgi:hypothetical protein
MPGFPYRKRPPRVPPEAPQPEPPELSDARFAGIMIRIGITAGMITALYAVMRARGQVRGYAGLAALLVAIVTAAVPDLRRSLGRGWLWYFGYSWRIDDEEEP